jgi:hypothetical protein
VSPRASLDTEVRGKILCPCRESNPDRPVVQPVVEYVKPRKYIVIQKIKAVPLYAMVALEGEQV